ncbi:hypothetical protein BH10PSE19_BH10PSE19_22680 [soil metagenome]
MNEIITLPRLEQLPYFIESNNLDGTNGSNRFDVTQCQLRAMNDYEAISCWLAEYQHKATTHRLYQKEVERLLLWCIFQQKKSLSSLDREDFARYFDFLSDPQPKALWCAPQGGRGRVRGDQYWRPFAGALSQSTKNTTITVINSLISYLTEGQYLRFNPLSLVRKRHQPSQSIEEQTLKVQERILELEEWYALLDTLEFLPESSLREKNEKERLRFLIAILYFTGIRINELTSHTWSAFRKVRDQWWLWVVGKGDKLGKIPVNDELLQVIIRFRTHLNYPSALPQFNDIDPLIPSSHKTRALSARYINKLLKKLAVLTAKIHFADQPEKVEKLKKFSAHWLRHLSASMQDRVGIQFKHIRANHRHEHDETTRRYVHAWDHERHADMQKLRLRINLSEVHQATK